MQTEEKTVFFAPELYIENGVMDVSFYEKAFDAIEHLCFRNDDGSIHVVEYAIHGAIFHIHEVMAKNQFFSPETHNRTTVTIGLFVPDVHAVVKQAIEAGAIEINPVQDYDYGYRQGTIRDPFGHYWQIQKKI